MIAMGMFRYCVVCAPIFSMHRWHPLWFVCTTHLEDRGIELAVGALGVAPGAGGALRKFPFGAAKVPVRALKFNHF